MGTLAWIAMGEKDSTTNTVQTPEDAAFGSLDDFVYTRTEAGKVQWEIRAEQARYYPDQNEVQLDRVDGQMNSPGRQINLKGERGHIDLQARTGMLEGNVVGRSDDGYVLRTTRISFDANNNTTYTDEPVLLEGKNLTLQGVGMELNLDEQVFRLKDQVKASMWQEGNS